MAFERFAVALGDGTMAGLRFGADGPPDLVFLHATGFNALTYRELLAPLGARWRVVALDQRGHGRSTLTADPRRIHGWDFHADDLADILPALVERAPVLAGHSMGGAVAAMAVARDRRVADRLVLLDPVLPGPEWNRVARTLDQAARIAHLPIARGAARRRSRFASRDEAFTSYVGRGAFATWTGSALADYVADGFDDATDGGVALTCAPAWEAATFAGSFHDGDALAAKLDVPTLILRAETGSATRATAAVRPSTIVETLPGTTHFLPMERPDVVRARLAAALEARDAALT